MRIIPTALLAASVALTASAGAALACSCIPYGSAAEQLAATDLAFKGRVVGAQSTGPDMARTTFRVTEVLKGPKVRTVGVSHRLDGAACGVRYRKGQTVWVFADRAPDGRWRTGLCAMRRFDEEDYRRAARGEPVPTSPPPM